MATVAAVCDALVVRGLSILFATGGFVLSVLALVTEKLILQSEQRQVSHLQRIQALQDFSVQRHKERESGLTISSYPSDTTVTSVSSENHPAPEPRPPSQSRSSYPQPSRPAHQHERSKSFPGEGVERPFLQQPLSPLYPSTSATTTEMHDAIIFTLNSGAQSAPLPRIESGIEMDGDGRGHRFCPPMCKVCRRSQRKRRKPTRVHTMPESHHPAAVTPFPSPPLPAYLSTETAPVQPLHRSPSAPAVERTPRQVVTVLIGNNVNCSTGSGLKRMCPSRHASSQQLSPVQEKSSGPPPSRTNPYSAPYFFPAPGSPDAVDYVRLTREDNRRRAVSSDHTRPSEAPRSRTPSKRSSKDDASPTQERQPRSKTIFRKRRKDGRPSTAEG